MKQFDNMAHRTIRWVENLGLIVIAVATVVAMGSEILAMFRQQAVHLADLLLLFIYLEVLAMVSIYLESGQLPVRIPLYIAIVALARYLILDMKNMDNWRLLGIAGAALMMAATVLVIRYGHNRFPYEKKEHE
jgi:protein PsiE